MTAADAGGGWVSPLGITYEIRVPPEKKQQVSKWALQDYAARLLPNDRVASCMRTVARGSFGVTLKRRNTGGVSVSGALACGSVWTCPVCAARVAELKRQALQARIDEAVRRGHGVCLVTLTFSHHRTESCLDLRKNQAAALRTMRAGRAFQAVKKRWGIRGTVRALEVTHSERNGWHPHTHEILFTESPLTDDEQAALANDLYLLWRPAAVKAGLGSPQLNHGVDVRGATAAASYVGKWGFAAEVTRSAVKKAARGGSTPWQLLARAAGGDRRAAHLWREFAGAFHGSRQLYTSAGLAAWLDVPEAEQAEIFSDAELSLIEPTEVQPVAFVALPVWYEVLRRGDRSKVLHLAEHDPPGLASYLESIRAARDFHEWGRLWINH